MTFIRRRRKKSGGYRTVLVPSPAYREYCREILPEVTAVAMSHDVHGVQHGFTPGRNSVTAAEQHVGYRWTLSFDLKDCFDHLLAEHFSPKLRQRWTERIFYRGVAMQGLPTSPAVCNIALSSLDDAIVTRLAGRGVYTRYADDLVISTNDYAVVEEMRAWLPQEVARHHQEVNERKTTLQWSGAGRRIVNGVSVGDRDVRATRRTRRRLRAAVHQARLLARWCVEYAATPLADLLLLALMRQVRHARGLAEWAACKRPDPMSMLAIHRNAPYMDLLVVRHRSDQYARRPGGESPRSGRA